VEVFGLLAGGFATALQPVNIAFLFVGVTLGLVIGVLPGLGGTSGVAILLPISVVIARGDIAGANSTTAVILLAGIYWGALFGGVITSILFNIPGEPWSVVLLFDGFPLAKRKGKPGLALTCSFVSSFVGAFIATGLFTLFAKEIADRALAFGPPELFAVFVLSFATLVGLGAESPLKALAMLALGLLLAAVGFDTITGSQRLIPFAGSEIEWLRNLQINLLAGVGFVPVTIGLFGIGEILASAEEQGIGYMEQISARLGFRDLIDALRALRQRLFLVISNSVIGFLFGVLPGHGATAASFLGYGLARQYSKNKEDFGKGEISGIMGPQATADAAGVASLVPMVTLGVPGSPTSAVIMAGLFVWGLQPGPLLFTEHSDFVWGLIASIYVGHFLTFMLCLLAVPLLASIMRVPYAVITPFIVVISIIGSYSLNNSMLDVAFTVLFGLIGYWLRKMKYPLAPLVVALVLGDSTERELRKTLIAGHGDPAFFFSSTLSTIVLILAVVILVLPLVGTLRGRLRPAGARARDTGPGH
jgi:putative tricarboxylic transport membrane protein